jgi:hypothetical protein
MTELAGSAKRTASNPDSSAHTSFVGCVRDECVPSNLEARIEGGYAPGAEV